MIPIQLSLKNFMSYGEEMTLLDLTGVQLACLSGDNGNGKSAILDAITYVLWGKTRASGSAASVDNDLIRLGADEMEVGLEFLLGAERYRVVRKRSRKNNSGDWHVHLSDGNGAWLAVGGTGARETEKNLTRILRMEHETFLNSAYFQQGMADVFARQKPEARKRILGDILDLKRYDRLSDLAKNHRDECARAVLEMDGEIRVLEARLAEEPRLTETMVHLEADLAQKILQRDERSAALNALQKSLAAIEEKARRLAEAENRLAQDLASTQATENELARLRERLSVFSSILQDQERITAEHELLGIAQRRAVELEGRVQELNRNRQEQISLERRLDQLRFGLQQQIDREDSGLKLAERNAAEAESLKIQIAEAGPKLQELDRSDKELETAKADRDTASAAFSSLKAENEQIDKEIAEIGEVLELLSTPRAACPVCESDLTGNKRETVIARQEQKKNQLLGRQSSVKREGAARKKDKEELEKRILLFEGQVRQLSAMRAQVVEWSHRMAQAATLAAEQKAIAPRLDVLRQKLASNDFGADERAALLQVTGRIALLESCEKELKEVRASLKDLQDRRVEARVAQLAEAEKSAAQLRKDISERETNLAAHRKTMAEEGDRLKVLRAELSGQEDLRRRTTSAEQEFLKLNAICEEARSHVGRTRQALDDCKNAKSERDRKAGEREKAAKEKQAFAELAAAFGRSGVQALVIHNVLPEIEEEANRLLARMTDNAMRVTLDTQRSARIGGGQIETLDISITDDAGTRPYEMFSGGEAFRVNFAIRIALSRLLARRAGARLQTLIIDEGFGTQDSKGRDRLVEAIQSIQDEFALILVITHMEDLKDAFPTRIDVVKGPNGSRISVAD